MPLSRKLQQVADELSLVDDPQERLSLVVERGRRAPELPLEQRTPAHRVPGCVSVVWLAGEVRAGECHFRCAAESPMVRGLVAFLCDFYSGFKPAEILAVDADPLEATGIARNLSPTRRNGLNAARQAIRAYAARHAAAPS